MTEPLDVLLIETRRNAGLLAAAQLDIGGHRVHRCRPMTEQPPRPADAQDGVDDEVCAAITEGSCPIDGGTIDVAVVAGSFAPGQPVLTNAGVTCALRHQIPLVADDTCGATFGARLAGRANGDVVGACVRATQDTRSGLQAGILARLGVTFAAHHVDPALMGCRIETDGPRLNVIITGPPADSSLRQALGVRVLDAIRSTDRVYGQVNVAYEATAPAAAASC